MTFTEMSLKQYDFVPRSSRGHTISYNIDLRVFKYVRYQIAQQAEEIYNQTKNHIDTQTWRSNDFQ
jgi:hypothetical protein